jgi:hypothetical protein
MGNANRRITVGPITEITNTRVEVKIRSNYKRKAVRTEIDNPTFNDIRTQIRRVSGHTPAYNVFWQDNAADEHLLSANGDYDAMMRHWCPNIVNPTVLPPGP